MSFASDCPACAGGNHAAHDRDFGIRPGVMGGTHCPCEGNCAERAEAAANEMAKAFGWTRTSETRGGTDE